MEKSLHKVANKLYQQIDIKPRIYLADSFVSIPQKIDRGNGEAKLYLGNESSELRDFFGPKPFKIKCFFKKNELLQFMEELESEYRFPQQNYRKKNDLPSLFDERVSKISEQDDIIWLDINEQDQITPPRIYGKSNDIGYKFLRELPLPTLSYLSFIKMQSNDETIFHARLFTDFMPLGSRHHPSNDPNQLALAIEDSVSETKIRKGQSKFRKDVLDSCPFCPITKVSDDRLLEAAHIKPYPKCTINEKYNKFNGVPLTPSMHTLYDLGFITVSHKSSLIISEWISKVTVRNLGISNNLRLPIPDFNSRKEFFRFHQENVFKS